MLLLLVRGGGGLLGCRLFFENGTEHLEEKIRRKRCSSSLGCGGGARLFLKNDYRMSVHNRAAGNTSHWYPPLRVVSARHWHNSFLQAAQIPPMLFNETPFHANLFAQKEGFVLYWTLRLRLTLNQGSKAVPRRPALALPQHQPPKRCNGPLYLRGLLGGLLEMTPHVLHVHIGAYSALSYFATQESNTP